MSVLGLLLPDQRLDHELGLVQRRVPDREDHLITWGRLDESTPMFLIESDATIVAPLVFAALLDW